MFITYNYVPRLLYILILETSDQPLGLSVGETIAIGFAAAVLLAVLLVLVLTGKEQCF